MAILGFVLLCGSMEWTLREGVTPLPVRHLSASDRSLQLKDCSSLRHPSVCVIHQEKTGEVALGMGYPAERGKGDTVTWGE